MNFQIRSFERVSPAVAVSRSLDLYPHHLGLIAKDGSVSDVYVVSELLEEPYHYEYPETIKTLKRVADTLHELETFGDEEHNAVGLNFLLYYEGIDLEDIRPSHVSDLTIFESESDESIAKTILDGRLDDDLEPYFDYESYADNQYCTGVWTRFEYKNYYYKIVKED